jgi:polyhydroxyalkanoate synthesis regulator phasin
MNDFLETLEIGENKVKLSKEEIKAILAEHGKTVKTETEKVKTKYEEDITSYKNTIDDLKKQIETAPKSDEIENLKTKIADYEQKENDRIAKQKAEEEDNIITKNILDTFGEKKFINDYTKNSIVNEIKTALKDKANVGKSAKDLFEEITNGKDGIFANPNQMVDMPNPDEGMDNTITKEAFEKMGYKERIELKQSNPELFNKFNN